MTSSRMQIVRHVGQSGFTAHLDPGAQGHPRSHAWPSSRNGSHLPIPPTYFYNYLSLNLIKVYKIEI